MNRIKSASGTTSGVNQNIVPIMRATTKLNGVSDTIDPFRIKAIVLSFTTNTTININGEGSVSLKLDSNGQYTISLDEGDVLIKTLTVADTGKVWTATFLF